MRTQLPSLLLMTTTALVATTLAMAMPAISADKTQVTVLTIGYPDKDTTDAATGAVSPGIDKLEAAFEAAIPCLAAPSTTLPTAPPATRYPPNTQATLNPNPSPLNEIPLPATYPPRG